MSGIVTAEIWREDAIEKGATHFLMLSSYEFGILKRAIETWREDPLSRVVITNHHFEYACVRMLRDKVPANSKVSNFTLYLNRLAFTMEDQPLITNNKPKGFFNFSSVSGKPKMLSINMMEIPN